MIILSLNIRGVGGPLKLASMHRLLSKTTPHVIFLQETLTTDVRARDFMFSLKPDWMSCVVSSVGNSGGC
jgi:exonuclease III